MNSTFINQLVRLMDAMGLETIEDAAEEILRHHATFPPEDVTKAEKFLNGELV